ncbi:hypothetical protein GF367_04205 [Candidatus Woesearchaeota archaeon]|nr:hypothetical protein [Candidatus Woesearchaeota archaeon]
MRGKIFVTILGLLLFQALAALYMGATAANFVTEIIVALIFIIAALVFLARGTPGNHRGAFATTLAFAFGFLHVVYLSFHVITLWLVVILCLDAAGFILSLDRLAPRDSMPPPVPPTHARKRTLERELPRRAPSKVTVYEQSAKQSAKRAVKRKPARKKATKKKPVRKKPVRKKATKKKPVRKKPVRRAAKKR